MRGRNIRGCVLMAALAVTGILAFTPARVQAKEIKVGVIYDYTGPFAAGGSQAAAIGTKIAIDMINERGGGEGYRVNAIYADAQSKAEVAINEATGPPHQEKGAPVIGVYSSP